MQTLFLNTDKGKMAKFIQNVRHWKIRREWTKPQKANTSISNIDFREGDFQESFKSFTPMKLSRYNITIVHTFLFLVIL